MRDFILLLEATYNLETLEADYEYFSRYKYQDVPPHERGQHREVLLNWRSCLLVHDALIRRCK